MRAIRYEDEANPIVLREIATPTLTPDAVRVDIKAASLCGSDVHYRDADAAFVPRTIPLTLGHEGAGVVTDVGDRVHTIAEGDHVIVHYVIACGDCDPCLAGFDNRCRNRQSIGADVDGTLAEEIVLPARSAIPMDEALPFAWGSIVGCAGATAFHAVERSGMTVGDTVAVFGAGGVGLHVVLWSAFRGAETILAIEPVSARRTAAEAMGAHVTIDPADDVREAIDAVSGGWGVDVAFECSGTSTAMASAIDAVDGDNRFESGTVVSVGLQETPFEANFWGLREGQVMVSGDHTRRELQTIADLMAAGRIELSEMIAERIGLDDVAVGLDSLSAGEVVGRVVVEP